MICLTATWAILWLSGKNMGEAARLWLVVDPLLLGVAAVRVASLWKVEGENAAKAANESRRIPLSGSRAASRGESLDPAAVDARLPLFTALLIVQGTCTALVVTRVTGFHFEGM